LEVVRFIIGCLYYFRKEKEKAIKTWNKKFVADQSYYAIALDYEYNKKDMNTAIKILERIVYDDETKKPYHPSFMK
jgi:hypothetical protein